MTQSERVLAALRRAGARGVTQVDFGLPNVIDGGAPITRLAARIQDLKNQGHRFEVRGKRDKCAVYVLVSSDASGVEGSVGDSSGASEGIAPLFDPRGLSKPLSPYDVDRAA